MNRKQKNTSNSSTRLTASNYPSKAYSSSRKINYFKNNKINYLALHEIASEAKEILNAGGFTVLADKGYHNGRELQDCQNNVIQPIVAPNEIVNSNKFGTSEDYLVTKFTY